MQFILAITLLLSLTIVEINCHGRLLDPPARSTAWRYNSKFNNQFPANYNDHQMFCGGASTQYNSVNQGRCGICGEAFVGPKEWEKGGSMYRGIIVDSYTKGQTIEASVEITANHKGYFEFRLCNLDNLSGDATHSCLDENVLVNSETQTTRTVLTLTGSGIQKVKLLLPPNLTCQHCVFQWKYNAGNSWGVDPDTGIGGIGLGDQEQFYGCSDVTITGGTNPITTTTKSTSSSSTTTKSTSTSAKSTASSSTTTKSSSISTSTPFTSTKYPENDCYDTKINYCTGITEIREIAHPTDCNKFVYCRFYAEYIMRCPSGYHFNAATQNCDLPEDANCSSSILRALENGHQYKF